MPRLDGMGADGTGNRELPAKVGILLIPQFSMMSFASAVEPLRAANRISGRALYQWRLFSVDGQPVEASNGIAVIPHACIDEVDFFPSLFVCAALQVQAFNDKHTMAWLRRLHARGANVGGICTGQHILARAGLLSGYRCTIHWENLTSFREQFPDLDVTSRLFEIDRERFTCSGGTAALDMMLHLIAREHGHALTAAVSEQFLHGHIRRPNEPQRMKLQERMQVSHPKLLAVIAQMERHIEEPLTLSELADNACLSKRQVERLFEKYLHQSPARYYLGLRLDRARTMLTQSSLPILDVAIASGFVSFSHFTRRYREAFGHTPREERAPDRLYQ